MAWEGKREGTYVCLWLIHVDVWRNQHCKAIIFLLKINKFKRKVYVRTFLAVCWLRLRAFNVGGRGSIPGSGNRSHMLQEPTCHN